MTERALDETVVQASLLDIHLPAEAAGGWPAELAAALALGGAVALVIGALLRLLSVGKAAVSTPVDLAAMTDLRDTERRVALLHILRSKSPERLRALAPRLYRPDGLSLAEIEREVQALD